MSGVLYGLYVPSDTVHPSGKDHHPGPEEPGDLQRRQRNLRYQRGPGIAGGSFTSTSGNLYLAGNFSVTAGTFTHNSGTILFDGTSNASVNTGEFALNNVTVDKGLAGRTSTGSWSRAPT